MGAGKRYGFDSYIGVGKETTWGTPVTRTKFQEIGGESGGHNAGRSALQTWRSRAPVGFIDVGTKSLKSYTMPMTYEQQLEWFRNALWSILGNGTYSFSTVSTTVIRHVFKIGSAKPPSLTVEGAGTDASASGATLFSGAFVRKIVFDFKASDWSTVAVDFVAKGETRTTRSASPTFASTTLYAKPGTFTIVIDSDTGSQLELDAMTITCESGIDEGRAKLKGDVNIVEPEPTGKASVTATFARDYNVESMYNKLISGASASISIKSAGTTIAGSSPTTPYSITALIAQAIILGDPPAHTGPGIVPENINLAAQDDATNSMFKLTIESLEAGLT